jgi:hypothetical protein
MVQANAPARQGNTGYQGEFPDDIDAGDGDDQAAWRTTRTEAGSGRQLGGPRGDRQKKQWLRRGATGSISWDCRI